MLEEPTEVVERLVCERLNTTPDQMQRDVISLLEWTKTQPHLPQCSSKTMVTTFYVASKGRVERARERLDGYYSTRAQLPEFFKDRDPRNERFLQVNQEIRMFFLPKLTGDGCRVTMVTFATGDPRRYNVPLFVQRALMQEDVKMNREAINSGRYFVLDAARFSALHATKLSPRLCMQMIHCAQNVLPVNIRGVIFINAPSVLDIVLAIIRPFTKSKLFERFYIHSEGPEVLERYFSKSLLPSDYGGEADSSQTLNANWLKCLEEHRDWLQDEGVRTTDESKRKRPPPQHPQQTMGKGTHGQEHKESFRTLNID